jgi:hypothetical protein
MDAQQEKIFIMKHHIPLKRFEYCTAEQGAMAKNRVTIEIDELVFSLQGVLEDGLTINSCSGRLAGNPQLN